MKGEVDPPLPKSLMILLDASVPAWPGKEKSTTSRLLVAPAVAMPIAKTTTQAATTHLRWRRTNSAMRRMTAPAESGVEMEILSEGYDISTRLRNRNNRCFRYQLLSEIIF